MSVRTKRIAAFLQLAEEELTAAELLVEKAPRQAAYLCQQCAEKIARAILTGADVAFGTGHNLARMAAALPEEHSWKQKIRSLDRHSPAATRYRYPSMAGDLFASPGTRRRAWTSAAPSTPRRLDRQPLLEDGEQLLALEGLRDVIVHADREALLAVPLHRVGGDRDHR